MDVREMGLSTRARNCLLAENIQTVEELVQYSAKHLRRIPNMGANSMIELYDALAAAVKGGFIKVAPLPPVPVGKGAAFDKIAAIVKGYELLP